MNAPSREAVRYTFGPQERRGIFGGVRPGQTVLIGVGMAAAVLLLQLGSSAGHAAAAMAAVVLAAALSFYRVAGRTVEEWTPLVAAFGVRRLRRRLGFRSPAPGAGVVVDGDGRPAHPVAPPGSVGGLELLSAPVGGGGAEIGVVKDRRAQTYTATLAVRVRSFGLLGDAEQERRLAAWGSVLSELARDSSPVRRLAWVERTVPNDGDELNGYLQEERDPALPLRSSIALSYIELLDSAADVTQDHEILLSLQIDGRRAWRQVKKLGKGDEGALRLLVRELDMLARRLDGAGIQVHGALTPRRYARAIRDGFDPFGRRARARREALASGPEGALAAAWPRATESGWDRYTADSATHVTYWAAEWPRIDVGATFLQPLLMATPNVVRSVAVVMDALAPAEAVAEVERARTEDLAEEETRRRIGQITTARHRLRHEATARRERELAEGHAELRYSGFVTVSAPVGDDEQLDRACAEVEHAAHQARLGLERLYGVQDSAFTFGLPLARGLR